MDLPSDQDLISDIQRGDDKAFATLYHRHRDWVVNLAFRWTGNHDDALDVLQETFAYVLSRLPDLHLTAKFTTFLYPAVRNLSLATRRKRLRYIGADLDVELSPVASPADQNLGDLQIALSNLGHEHREIVLMRFVDDFSLEEIAAALDIPLGTVKSRLHNALRILGDDPKAKKYFL